MSRPRRSPDLEPRGFLAHRRARLERLLARPLGAPPRAAPVPPERRRFLREEAEELYWSELAWERLTADGPLRRDGVVEHAFPGFLTFIDGLLLREAGPSSPVPASPRPQVVEDIALFLARRCLELDPRAGTEAATERELTERLLDLVLCRLHGLPLEEVERLERARDRGERR